MIPPNSQRSDSTLIILSNFLNLILQTGLLFLQFVFP